MGMVSAGYSLSHSFKSDITHLGFTEEMLKTIAIAQDTGSVRIWRQPGMDANCPNRITFGI